MVSVGAIAVDGTKLHVNASMSANRSYEKITEEILADAAAADAEEGAQLGELRGDELPARLRDRSSRKARLKAAKERLEREPNGASSPPPTTSSSSGARPSPRLTSRPAVRTVICAHTTQAHGSSRRAFDLPTTSRSLERRGLRDSL
jgi:hypothetical protein